MAKKAKKTIELALQGGGAHGAITWGVLDRLLEEKCVFIEALSGTSAGAMNAVVLVDGLAWKGREGAQEKLHHFWEAVSQTAILSPLQRTWWDRVWGNWNLDQSLSYKWLDLLSRIFSPYQINPFDINPLRTIIDKHVDFERVNTCNRIKVFVTATNVNTGLPRIFRQPEITVQTLLASAALPLLYKAVEIDGQHFWDGGFMGNPALFPLVDECASQDLVIVQVNPFQRQTVPTTARQIINRMNEITFNASLFKELRAIILLQQMIESKNINHEQYRSMRIHSIHADEDIAHLSASSKYNAQWPYLLYLRDLGRAQADRWLKDNWHHIGERATFDLSWVMDGSIRPINFTCPPPNKKDTL